MDVKRSKLKRPRQLMADDVAAALESRQLLAQYQQRPAYQQNDYLSWIERAKRPETRQKRLAQMLDELAEGGIYMNMKHPASARI